MVVPLNHTYASIVKAFRSDCENLIGQFKEKHSDDFRDFVQIWKSLKFNLIYEKYSKYGLNYDFKEDSLQLAKSIMFNDHFVGGIFLLYGLYYVQEDPKASIRLEYYEFEKIFKLIKDERKTLIETCQPGYLFAKLLKNNAFHFVRFSRDFSMEGHNRTRVIFGGQPVLMHEGKNIDEKKWIEGFLNKIDFLDNLKEVEKDYFQKKQKLKEDHPELNLALDVMPDDLVSGIIKNLQPTTVTQSSSSPESIGVKRKKLKSRKMRTKPRYTRKDTTKQKTESEVKIPRKRGPPRGKRKLYFKTMVNDPQTETEETEESDEMDDIELRLPDIL